jgi:hypothetical protein
MKFLPEGSQELQQLIWLAADFENRSGFSVDPQELLAQRVRHTQWQASEFQSVGGSCHLMLTGDHQWVAVNVARPEDHELLGIFFPIISRRENQIDISQLRDEVGRCTSNDLINFAIEVGLPISRLGEMSNSFSHSQLPVHIQIVEKVVAACADKLLEVVDLSSLWAGPLCSHLLQRCGYSVTKVESQQRPDGARFGNPNFFAELDAGKNHVVIDLGSNAGVNQLHELIKNADVIIEGSRPRALQQLGIDAEQILTEERPRVWLSITGYGRDGVAGQRVGFGDDCAVAGGMVDYSPTGPQFLGDAIADPVTGLVSATAILRAVTEQKPCLIAVSLAETASWLNSVRGNRESQQD